jgi:hypothetical protein
MPKYKMINGERIQLTAQEETEYQQKQTAFQNALPQYKLKQIKSIRLEKLQETDYMANSDVTMPSYIKTWRQTLRDLPQNNTTESQYDTLLARDADGNLTNSVWTQPTE